MYEKVSRCRACGYRSRGWNQNPLCHKCSFYQAYDWQVWEERIEQQRWSWRKFRWVWEDAPGYEPFKCDKTLDGELINE